MRARLAVCASLLVAMLSVAGATSAMADERRATLRLGSARPVTLTGSGFHPRERVRLWLSTGDARHFRSARAGQSGTFLVHFPGVYVDRCNSTLAASAAGAHGTRAALKLPLLPQCPPALRRP